MEYVYKRPKKYLRQFEISNWHDFLFCSHEDFIAPSLCNNFFWLWDESFGSERDCEVVIKSTSFVKIFWKFKEHLFFGCFGVCIYCIGSVISVTFYLNSQLSTCLHVHFDMYQIVSPQASMFMWKNHIGLKYHFGLSDGNKIQNCMSFTNQN